MSTELQPETAQFCGLWDIAIFDLQPETGVTPSEMAQKETPVSGAEILTAIGI